MKKSIIALAVAGALTAPMIAQADATLFGGVRFEVVKVKNTKVISTTPKANIGVKGSETMNNGLTAGYYIEYKSGGGSVTSGTVDLDKANVYVAGDFGTVTFGKSDTSIKAVEGRAKFLAFSDGALAINSDNINYGGIAYTSGDMNGLSFAADVGNVRTSNDAAVSSSAYSFNVAYDTDVFGVTLGAGKNDESGDSQVGIGAQFHYGAGTIGASFSKENTVKVIALGANYKVDQLTLAAEFNQQKNSGSTKPRTFGVSASYDLGGNAYVAAEYLDRNSDAGDADQLKLRYNVSF
ncbi:MAG: porin [Oceanospirillaceae bacterium]|nr:porin [Oceanospirillaceae bacterium]